MLFASHANKTEAPPRQNPDGGFITRLGRKLGDWWRQLKTFLQNLLGLQSSVKEDVFEKVLNGRFRERPLLESKHAAVFLNITPAREGHALVISRNKHAQRLKELSLEEAADVMKVAQNYQRLWDNLPANRGKKFDYAVFVQDGDIAGQTIPRFHMHIVPIAEEQALPKGTIRKAINSGKECRPLDCEIPDRLRKIYRNFSDSAQIRSFAENAGLTSHFESMDKALAK